MDLEYSSWHSNAIELRNKLINYSLTIVSFSSIISCCGGVDEAMSKAKKGGERPKFNATYT